MTCPNHTSNKSTLYIYRIYWYNSLNDTLKGEIHSKACWKFTILRFRLICFLIRTDLEKCSITYLLLDPLQWMGAVRMRVQTTVLHRVCPVQLPKQTSVDYNGQSGLLRGLSLPSLQELYTSRVKKRAKKVILDPSHPAHALFELLPSGRRYRSLSTKTARHKNSFSPRPYPTWTTHNTPQYCTSVNNSSNLHLYIGHMHIHSSAYWHFILCIFVYFITIVIHNYCLFSSLLVFFITLMICCLHYVCTFCTEIS